MTEPAVSTTTTNAIAATPEGSTPPGAMATEPRSLGVRIISSLGFAAIAIVGVLIVLYAWQLPPFSSAVETTENALVRGQVTIISPQLGGYVFEVPVQDFQHVKAGDLLVRLDDRIYKQRLDQALAQRAVQQAALANVVQQRNSAEATIKLRQAALVDSQAQARKSTADLRRNEELISDGSVSRRELDVTRAANAQTLAAVAQAQASLEIARQDLQTVIVNRGSLEAAVASAEAAVELARIDLSNTRVLAPRDGQLGQIGVRLGAYVNSGAQLMALVPNQLWVIANMKETQMDHVQVGQPVTFTVDALDHRQFHGTVQRISPATGSEFSLLQADNATGNFVKIAQRVPVRITVDPDQEQGERLRPGLSVVVSIDTAGRLKNSPP
ncbi:HlyD family secretion protein [Pseudomonas gessardii]|uniref:HlyD family efflux transporter periplasmic adaptor subunit n=3 Tax=Pseudomonas gessardii TaxID=78544 RepID=A0A7Y1QL72_9PSED|nr:HlyD family secretion protein [Pseudomonas gessardii]MBH3422990.1 HlyD family secretion protein [Pseudomonas gessardii]MCF4980801.1 HlyD family efflux transporter periplasmic adaptor subunit [Pseudomonas gessardii]MCF4991106.1 HlyD family efflux transporter periplasmic adaptor subunit [Pseudomonas gessardii]MCF5086506.1 HlyD family efflux transporter periplasmic adaptor subunit [Pseudomonas gessardii]MCF5109310.1 HlyD family efflux transporter periplasmic adaptor subunit [Pseudomonas gessar